MTVLVGIALAAPRFTGHPEDVRVAGQAWEAMEACTGWTGRAHPEVTIERGVVRQGFRGFASVDERGLHHIALDAADPELREVIVHEVAHAWVSEGPTALVEGRAELLADCAVHRRPGLAPLQWDDGRELVAMPDLRGWDAQDGLGPSVNPLQRTDAYVGAARLVRLASLFLPEGALWPADDGMDWFDLDEKLAEAGAAAEPLRALLRASGPELARALSDRDGDGLPELGEQLFGTDPDRFDTDGDGWWDGAAVVEGAAPLPFDGTPVCTGWSAVPGTEVRLRTGGNLRGAPAPRPVLRIGEQVAGGRAVALLPAPILMELHGEAGAVSGGIWARVEGGGLLPDRGCFDSERAVVWALRPSLRERAAALHGAIVALLERRRERFAPVERVAVALGAGSTRLEGPIVFLSMEEATGPVERVAARLVATRALAVRGTPSPRDVAALTEALLAP